MLSYQHSYHAGNPADVLKHLVLCLAIDALQKKPTPIHIFDSHAGAGEYNLKSFESLKTGEAETGIDKVYSQIKENLKNVPEAISNWVHILDEIRQSTDNHNCYPGSPLWAWHLLREQDRLTLLELHPAEHQKLLNWKAKKKRIQVFKEDSFKNLKSHLPPKENRGIVLIDPSYELLSDYSNVSILLENCLKRFAHGIYLIWYPIVARGADHQLLQSIKDLQLSKTLSVQINFCRNDNSFGMKGTGMIILNCPWKLDQKLATVLPWLTNVFSEQDTGGFKIEWLVQ